MRLKYWSYCWNFMKNSVSPRIFDFSLVGRKLFLPFKENIRIRFLYIFLIFSAFVVRVININYNSPFSDEAVYVVVGKLGIFQRDWWSYHATSWMGGSPFFYPTLTSIAYVTGGIVGSRLLNTLFGVLSIEAVFRIILLISKTKKRQGFYAGLLASFALAFAAPSIYVGKLATYDMPAFYFTLMGFYFLLAENNKRENNGRNYFFAAIFLLMGIFTKLIVLLYMPFIITYSYIKAKNHSRSKNKKYTKIYFWRNYFLLIILSGGVFYLATHLTSLISFYKTQTSREVSGYLVVSNIFMRDIFPMLTLYLISAVGFIYKKSYMKWFIFLLLATLPLVFHLATHRMDALDKHVYMSLAVLAIGSGYGFSLFPYKSFKSRSPIKYSPILAMVVFILISFYQYNSNYNLWKNTDKLTSYLRANVKEDDLILAENGPEVILGIYEKNFPLNTTTFDYIDYESKTELSAYYEAVRDGYFDYIEYENVRNTTSEQHEEIYNTFKDQVEENYLISYSDEDFIVYKRKY